MSITAFWSRKDTGRCVERAQRATRNFYREALGTYATQAVCSVVIKVEMKAQTHLYYTGAMLHRIVQ
jgi:hypothetical protein